MTRIGRWFAIRRYRLAQYRYWLRYPSRWGDPLLGKTREQRNHNLDLMVDSYAVGEPKPADYGLTQEDVR